MGYRNRIAVTVTRLIPRVRLTTIIFATAVSSRAVIQGAILPEAGFKDKAIVSCPMGGLKGGATDRFALTDVRFGSKADMCVATSDVRFNPNSDRESGFPQTVMSALPQKADMCGALAHVRFGPKADMRRYSITSSAQVSSDGGTVTPRLFAVLRLIASSNCTFRS